MIRRNFLQKSLGGVVALIFLPTAARTETAAQRRKRHGDPTPTPSPSPGPLPAPVESPTSNQETARLRLWKAADTPDQAVQFRLIPLGKPDAKAISPVDLEVGSYQFSSYVEVPAGPMIAEVSALNRPTIRLPVHLSARGQSTLLVRLRGAGLSAEWIDNTLDPTDNGCEFSVYNLLPANGDIQVDLGTILTVHLSAARSSLRLGGIKRASYPVIINGTDGNGKSFRWNTDADFRQYRQAALLIYPDAYGRVRPRINPA